MARGAPNVALLTTTTVNVTTSDTAIYTAVAAIEQPWFVLVGGDNVLLAVYRAGVLVNGPVMLTTSLSLGSGGAIALGMQAGDVVHAINTAATSQVAIMKAA